MHEPANIKFCTPYNVTLACMFFLFMPPYTQTPLESLPTDVTSTWEDILVALLMFFKILWNVPNKITLVTFQLLLFVSFNMHNQVFLPHKPSTTVREHTLMLRCRVMCKFVLSQFTFKMTVIVTSITVKFLFKVGIHVMTQTRSISEVDVAICGGR